MRHPARRHPSSFTVLAASLALAAAPLPGQAGSQPPSIRHDDASLTLPAGDLPLKDVVDAAAAFLKVNILYDRAEVGAQGGTILLQTPMTLARAKAETAVSDLVYANGFVLAPRDGEQGLYELVFLRGAKARDAMKLAPHRTVEQVMAQPTLKQPVTTSFALQNTNATIATNAMRPFFAATGGSAPTGITLGCAADNQTMLLSGIQSEVVKAIQILRQVDVKSEDAQWGVAPTGTADAQLQRLAELEAAVQQLRTEVAELKRRLSDRK